MWPEYHKATPEVVAKLLAGAAVSSDSSIGREGNGAGV